MIKRFIQQMENSEFEHITPEFASDLASLFPRTLSGSVSETMTSATFIDLVKFAEPTPLSDLLYDNTVVQAIGPIMEYAMNDELVDNLAQMYAKILREYTVVRVTRLCQRFVRVKLGDKLCSSQKARTDRNSYICAYWLGSDDCSIDTAGSCRPGCVHYYIKHNVLVKHHGKELSLTMYLAYVLWFKKHPEKHHFHLPNTVWYPDYVSFSEASFMPVSRIACRCMKGELELFFPERPFNNGKAIVINPISAGHFSF